MFAVLVGLLGTVIAFFLISSAGAGNTGPKIMIVVARHDMSPNLPIDPERDLKQIEIPREFSSLATRCLDWEARANYKGVRINREIFAGQPVLLGDLADSDFLILEKPYYALTLPAETGMIIPGDYVKIIYTKQNMLNAASSLPVAGAPAFDTTILGKDDGFKVLAVGAYLYKTRQQTLFVDTSASAVNAANNKTVTLQVTEAQAKEIMSAVGQLSSSNKAILLLCPSAKTAPPTEPPSAEPSATSTRPSTKP